MRSRNRWPFGLSSALLVGVLACGTAVAVPRLQHWLRDSARADAERETAVARRSALCVTLTTGGKVESAERTLIECELERLDVGALGEGMTGGGTSTVISVVPDGSTVKKGDILCELDASDYVELLRQQKMTVEASLADHRRAELELEVARMSVTEFKEGTLNEAFKEMEGLIALNESTWQRANDRLLWARRMLEKGYVPRSQIGTETINERRAAFFLRQSRTDLAVFREFTAPRALRSLEANVRAAEAQLNYQEQRLKRDRERQAMLELQVQRCTIRAPHDGFVIYASSDQRPARIEEGMAVHQKQDLFYLPNLNKMIAIATIHETVAGRVRRGMKASVRIEGLPGKVLDGHIGSVAQLPSQNFFSDVRFFYTEVVLDTIPPGLRPGMTAEVEIETDRRADVLAIPIEALAVEQGEDYCYVAGEEGIERREIEIGQSTRSLLEVTEGLEEGERVVINPASYDEELEVLSPFNTSFESRWGEDARK